MSCFPNGGHAIRLHRELWSCKRTARHLQVFMCAFSYGTYCVIYKTGILEKGAEKSCEVVKCIFRFLEVMSQLGNRVPA